MICTKCNNDAVQNSVLGKTFYYCRTCKCEVDLQARPVTEAPLKGDNDGTGNPYSYTIPIGAIFDRYTFENGIGRLVRQIWNGSEWVVK